MPFINVENVTIDIPVFDVNRSFRNALFNRVKSNLNGGDRIKQGGRRGVFVRALDGVTLKVLPGDRIGLVGRNGSGKTTLLRVLAGIYEPLLGSVTREGQITALFNTALGVDPDDTGLENIRTMYRYLTGGKLLVDPALVEDIKTFSDIGDFVNLPVRTYSAGMLVRICFATVTAIRPDILLMDEGIGAGDVFFSAKAKKRVDQFYGALGTLVVASHSHELIAELCTRAVLLDGGKIIAEDTVESVYSYYHRKFA